MKIKPVEKSDREIWETFFAAYAAFYKTEVPEGGYDRVWDWIFDPDNDFWCDLAFTDDGTAVGFSQYQLMHRSLSGAMVCYLSDLYVRPDIRGTGAGRALIDHVIDFARGRGIANVRWLTQDFNYRGRLLYDSYAPKTDFILYSIPV
ncbi:MAG: GNAT family N-acetyltransferase [Fimbriimonadaceae bacterium]|nr:GNAT family N-acetyltransferase [Alphaproteobacteria bacterium]